MARNARAKATGVRAAALRTADGEVVMFLPFADGSASGDAEMAASFGILSLAAPVAHFPALRLSGTPLGEGRMIVRSSGDACFAGSLAMNQAPVEVQGVLRADGTLTLDEKPNLPAGPVKVILQPMGSAQPKLDPWAALEQIWADRKARGVQPRSARLKSTQRSTPCATSGRNISWRVERIQQEARCVQGETALLIYVDSCVVIYLIEQPPVFGPRATARIAALLARGDKILVSELTRLGVSLRPARGRRPVHPPRL